MAGLADPANSLQVPGRLVAAPTDLSVVFPHGGTDLGLAAATAFRFNHAQRPITAEEYGGEIVEIVEGGEAAVLVTVLRGISDAAVEKVFPHTVTGGDTGEKIVRYPGTRVPGTLASVRKFKLLFAPEDTTNHPGVLLYNVLPLVDDSAELQMVIGGELGLPVVFFCTRDATNRVYEVAKLSDMTL